MSGNIQQITDADFEEQVLNAKEPVLVDFWAEWCAPCKALLPVLTELADEYQGKVKFVKMNIDEAQATPVKYEVKSIPTLLIFKDGNLQATNIGNAMKSQLIAFIDSHI